MKDIIIINCDPFSFFFYEITLLIKHSITSQTQLAWDVSPLKNNTPSRVVWIDITHFFYMNSERWDYVFWETTQITIFIEKYFPKTVQSASATFPLFQSIYSWMNCNPNLWINNHTHRRESPYQPTAYIIFNL